VNKEMREVCGGGKRKIRHGNLFLVLLLKVKIRVAKIILKINSNKSKTYSSYFSSKENK
jgi:hypothetical protein